MTSKEQSDKEEGAMVVEERIAEACRRKSDIDYLLLNYDVSDRRKGKDRRVNKACQPDTSF